MGAPAEPALVQPIAGILAASPGLLEEAREALEVAIARVEMASPAGEWTVSDYYRGEMGERIWRQYVALATLIRPGELAALKRSTNELESRWQTARGRQVNLDPGYLDLTKLVLASTKDASHRVYLGQGIYAEATLRYAHGGFEPWPYTYPDYAAADTRAFFNRVRARYQARRPAVRSPHPGQSAR